MGFKRADMYLEYYEGTGESRTRIRVGQFATRAAAIAAKVASRTNVIHFCTHAYPINAQGECFPCKLEEI